MQNNFKPDFIGIGAPKCGTSWLSRVLAEHSEISFSVIKETSFFCTEKNPFVHNYLLKYNGKNINKYKLFFKKNYNKKIFGEFSVQYLYDKKAAENIKENFPDVKILAVLRNPVSRFFSDFHYRKYMRKEIKTSIDETIEKNKQIIKHGFYFEQIKKYFQLFPRENIKIIIYEEMIEDPQKTIAEIYSFLKVNSSFLPQNIMREKINKTKKVKSRILMKIFYNIVILIIRMGGAQVVDFLLKNKIKNLLVKINFSEISKEKADPKTEEKLKKIYAQDVSSLEKLIKKDLFFWDCR